MDNSFILTQSRRCQVHRAKTFYQDELEHLFVFVYAKLFLLLKAKEPSLKVHAATDAQILITSSILLRSTRNFDTIFLRYYAYI